MDISLSRNAFVISCNQTKLNLFRNIFDYYKLPQPHLFDACLAYDGRLGCLLSHYFLYKLAYMTNMDYLIVYEDDILPRNDALKHFEAAIKHVPDDWKFLKLEDVFFNKFKNKTIINEYWFTGTNAIKGSGTGAYIIRRNALMEMIRLCESYRFDPRVPIDLLHQYIKGGFYILNDLMFLQHNLHNQSTLHGKMMFKNNNLLVDYLDKSAFTIPQKFMKAAY
jgi:GR25 family glycosyltransferase involved in LPS biosynthesis